MYSEHSERVLETLFGRGVSSRNEEHLDPRIVPRGFSQACRWLPRPYKHTTMLGKGGFADAGRTCAYSTDVAVRRYVDALLVSETAPSHELAIKSTETIDAVRHGCIGLCIYAVWHA